MTKLSDRFENLLGNCKKYLKKHYPFAKDLPRNDGRIMSLKATALFNHRKYIEQNTKTSLKPVLEYLEKEIYRSTYFGIPAMKCPLDYWIYTELIYELQPDVVIEIGNYAGGSLLSIAHLLDAMEKGRVIGVDIDHHRVPDLVRKHPRITLVTGDACAMYPRVKSMIKGTDKVLIVEDSAHTCEHTLNVLKTYHDLVTKGSYFIVEDGISYHGLDAGPYPGPYEAVEAFMRDNKCFEIDRTKERFLITWNPKGYLRRID